MKQLACEICGSSDIIKQDGVFVCQSCGCKYSVEDIQKILSATSEPNENESNKAFSKIDSYLQMAQNALEAQNNLEAEGYANRILEINPQLHIAWFIKGTAAGWQTTGQHNRFPESITNWINAYLFSPDDEKVNIADAIEAEIASISSAQLKMKCDRFENYRSEDNKKDIEKTLSMLQQQMDILKEKTGIDSYTADVKAAFAKTICDCADNASCEIISDFGTERRHQDKYNWEKYTAAQERCLSLLNTAYELTYDDPVCYSICKSYICIAELVRDSCSYKFVPDVYSDGYYVKDYSFTEAAIGARNKVIEMWKKRKKLHDPAEINEAFCDVLAQCEETVEEQEILSGQKQYWAKNAAQKSALDKEKSELEQKIKEAEKEKNESPLYKQLEETKGQIDSLLSERDSLGFFKGKEKKALTEKIGFAQNEYNDLVKKINAHKEQVDGKASLLQNRIQEINAELTKPRGKIAKTHGPKPEWFVAGSDEWKISPLEFIDFLKENLPAPYHLNTGTEEDLTNMSKAVHDIHNKYLNLINLLSKTQTPEDAETSEWQDDPDMVKEYRISIFNEEKQMSTGIFVHAKSPQAPIEGNLSFMILFFGKEAIPQTEAFDFAQVVSSIVFDLFPSASMLDLQKVFVGQFYGKAEKNKVSSDGFLCTFTREDSFDLTISLE